MELKAVGLCQDTYTYTTLMMLIANLISLPFLVIAASEVVFLLLEDLELPVVAELDWRKTRRVGRTWCRRAAASLGPCAVGAAPSPWRHTAGRTRVGAVERLEPVELRREPWPPMQLLLRPTRLLLLLLGRLPLLRPSTLPVLPGDPVEDPLPHLATITAFFAHLPSLRHALPNPSTPRRVSPPPLSALTWHVISRSPPENRFNLLMARRVSLVM
ncbi:hypothetical protein Taro_036205 [Colocasia esculenta]|uniref:Uncharacterized protein n=1 Tax=Colocasia esculenta TaxID=4460 RepID=A0A843W0Y7_COLES|nr:hypothetical protein [Colocasia esculenta]